MEIDYKHITLPSCILRCAMADKDPVSLLGERSQRLGLGNFRDAYIVTEVRHGEQAWEIQLIDNQTHKQVKSNVQTSKKKALKEAAKKLLEELGEGVELVAGADEEVILKSLNDDALIGDKVLGLCLVMWLRREYQIVDKGVVTRIVANLLSNEALQRNAHKIGIQVSGFQTHRDGSVVEQRAWEIFEEEGYDVLKTMERVKPMWTGAV